jgi:hypothetical protein
MNAESEPAPVAGEEPPNEVITISDNESEAGEGAPLPSDGDDSPGNTDSEMSESDGESILAFTPADDDDDDSAEPSSSSEASNGSRSLFALTAKRALTAWKMEMLRLSSTSANGLLRIKIEQISTMALFELGDRIMRELAKRQLDAPVVVDMTDD